MWRLYRVVLRLRSPLHVGHLKIGNLMHTRPYVLGKTIWGAITASLAIGEFNGDFQEAQNEVATCLAFSYFYPALEIENPLLPCYTEEGLYYGAQHDRMSAIEFERRLLSAYGSTALDYSCNAAAVGSLHEVEFISPYDQRDGRPVYLVGYIFERQESSLSWQDLLSGICLGGERKSGWGRVSPEQIQPQQELFGLEVELNGVRPRVYVPDGQPLLAHAVADSMQARGAIEPFLGRETHEASRWGGFISQDVSLCWTPGSIALAKRSLEINSQGLWQ